MRQQGEAATVLAGVKVSAILHHNLNSNTDKHNATSNMSYLQDRLQHYQKGHHKRSRMVQISAP